MTMRPLIIAIAGAIALIAMSCCMCPPRTVYVVYVPGRSPSRVVARDVAPAAPVQVCSTTSADACPSMQTCCSLDDGAQTGQCMDISMCNWPTSDMRSFVVD